MTTLPLLLVLCCASAAFADDVSLWDGLRVTWGPLGLVDLFHWFSFYDMPKTASDATSDSWVQAEDTDVSVYCMKNDPRVCMLYDANGVAAGIDVCILKADVDGLSVDFDFTAQEMYVPIERFGFPCYRARVFWVSEDELAAGRSTWKNGLGTGLWFVGKSGRVEIPIKESELPTKSLYTVQNCIPTMGMHYYYNMTEDADCSQFYPFFLLVDQSEGLVHGVGFQTYGISSKTDRKWFEDVPYIAIKPTVPTCPQCLVDWVKEVGTISLHIYFKDNPGGIGC